MFGKMIGAVLFSAALAVSSAWAGDQDFTLVNQTGVEIHKVYASPHSSNDWEEDILGDDTLEDGESVNITFSPKERAAMWDLRVEDGDGNYITWESINLLQVSKVTLHYKKNKVWATLE